MVTKGAACPRKDWLSMAVECCSVHRKYPPPIPLLKTVQEKFFVDSNQTMVSFSCESCQDTIKKPKLDNVFPLILTQLTDLAACLVV